MDLFLFYDILKLQSLPSALEATAIKQNIGGLL